MKCQRLFFPGVDHIFLDRFTIIYFSKCVFWNLLRQVFLLFSLLILQLFLR